MKPLTTTLDELFAAQTHVDKLTETVVAALKDTAAKLGYALVPGGAHPLVDDNGPVTTTSSGTPSTKLTQPFIAVRGAATPTTAKTLQCPHCPRLFARPLHLGRHTTTMHPRANTKKSRGR